MNRALGRGLIALLLASCTSGDLPEVTLARDATGALLPDTQTVDRVLVMRHSAAALGHVREWVLDSVPKVVYDDPTGEWDLSGISHAVPIRDRMLLTGFARTPGLMLFGPDGRPERLLARRGEGPGELGGIIWRNVIVVNDTIVVFDPFRRRVSRFTTQGFVRDTTWDGPLLLRCTWPTGYLAASHRFVYACGSGERDDTSARPVLRVGIGALAMEREVAAVSGVERRRRVEQTTAGMRSVWGPLTLGKTTQVVAWDSVVVVAAQDREYRLGLRDTAGALTGAIEVALPTVAVSDAIREAEIAKAVEWARRDGGHGGYKPGELERQAREQPIADTLPPHGEIHAASDGILWVLSPPTWGDTAWSALGFRHDGAIVARLRGSGDRTRRPIWFGPGRVMTRNVDGDGVVRLGVYGVSEER